MPTWNTSSNSGQASFALYNNESIRFIVFFPVLVAIVCVHGDVVFWAATIAYVCRVLWICGASANDSVCLRKQTNYTKATRGTAKVRPTPRSSPSTTHNNTKYVNALCMVTQEYGRKSMMINVQQLIIYPTFDGTSSMFYGHTRDDN